MWWWLGAPGWMCTRTRWWRACPRPGQMAVRRDPHFRCGYGRTVGVAGLAGRAPGDVGGDGVDRGVLAAVFYTLEDAMECWLLNAAHMRNVPGRKTDQLTELPGRFLRWIERWAVCTV